ncbi:MAG: alpha/beta fold hydrolase [Proteobacteria bacterium]|nr:alpha/beta fold hydrolase [Pseudomonadota bacterium]
MSDTPRTEFHPGWDGAPLAVHRLGKGRPLLLLHGLFSSAAVNWVKYGHAARLAVAGFEAIMPDLRGHGQSAAPHAAEAYPRDVLARDLAALVSALGLADYDLAGFSLGARTAVRGVVAGLAPARLVLGGMGLEGLTGWSGRGAFFVDVIDRFGTIEREEGAAWMAQAFLKGSGTDRVAARHLLLAVDNTTPEQLAGIAMPTLVVCGAEDRDNGSAPALAEALPAARYAEVPGNHMSCVTRPDLSEAMVSFLAPT